MSRKMKTLLVVSGGDAPGINTFVYEYTRLAAPRGHFVVGAEGGFAGILNENLLQLFPGTLHSHMALGGSFLPSSRDPVLKIPENRVHFADILRKERIDNVVLLGGDGTLRHIPPILRELGIACIGIPTTIDNDVPGTEQTIGYDTACNYAHHAIDGILATARALRGRVFSVETLGGNTGMLALDIAHVQTAHAVLVPEYDYDHNWLLSRVQDALIWDEYALIVLSEGIPNARTFPEDFQLLSGYKVRDTRLGHGQRGAPPIHRDRRLAKDMAWAAQDALLKGATFGTIVVQQGEITLYEGYLADLPTKMPDRSLYNRVNGLREDV
jgi:6-phosphofructokinase 1